MLSSPAVELSIAGAEHAEFDTANHFVLARQNELPKADHGHPFAGVQFSKGHPAMRLTENPSMVGMVENAALLAQDHSKLQWDFGSTAKSPAMLQKPVPSKDWAAKVQQALSLHSLNDDN